MYEQVRGGTSFATTSCEVCGFEWGKHVFKCDEKDLLPTLKIWAREKVKAKEKGSNLPTTCLCHWSKVGVVQGRMLETLLVSGTILERTTCQ